MNSTANIQTSPNSTEESLLKLSFDEKLKIAIQTLITGQLKDNHDDTLFEKLCSLLESEIENDHLIKFVHQESIFTLIDTNLPSFENVNTVIKHKDDFVAFFRIIGSLFSKEEIFNLYLTFEKDLFNLGDILIRIFPFTNDQTHDSKMLIFSYLTLIKNITSHKCGTKYILSVWFMDSKRKVDNSTFALDFIEFVKRPNSHYIQKELNYIFANLIDFCLTCPSSSSCTKFRSLIRESVFDAFSINHCKLLLDTLRLISDKRLFIQEFGLIENVIRFWKQSAALKEDELNNLIKLISRITSLFPNDLPLLSDLLQLTISKLHSSTECFQLITFLTLNINIDYSTDEFGSIHALWLGYMGKVFSLIRNFYYPKMEPIPDGPVSDLYLVESTLNAMSYQAFELKCFRVLDQIDATVLNSNDLLFIIRNLKTIIVKLTNRKSIVFGLTFLDHVVMLKSANSEIIAEVLAIYCDILYEFPLHRVAILGSLRRFFVQSSSLIYTEAVLLRIFNILGFCDKHLKEVEDFADNEMVDVITETIYNLIVHLDFERILACCANHYKQVGIVLEQIFQTEYSYLQNDDLEPTIRANIIASLYCVTRYSLNQKQLPISLPNVSLELLFSSTSYDYNFKQTLYFGIENTLKHSIAISTADCHFVLPFLCKFCMEENDTELQCSLVSTIKLLCEAYLHLENDIAQCVTFFLKCRLFALICTLISEPLIIYRTKVATLALQNTIHSWLMTANFTDDHAKLDFTDLTDTAEGVAPQDGFKFCLSTTIEDLRKSIEEQRDCPSVSILDDIISTSLITEDMVMDCY